MPPKRYHAAVECNPELCPDLLAATQIAAFDREAVITICNDHSIFLHHATAFASHCWNTSVSEATSTSAVS